MYWLNGTRKCQRSKCYIGSRKERKTVIYSNKCCKKKNLKELSEYGHSTSGISESGRARENPGSGSGMVVPSWELATTMNSVVHGWILSISSQRTGGWARNGYTDTEIPHIAGQCSSEGWRYRKNRKGRDV